MAKKKTEYYLIGKGYIRGTLCQYFWKIDSNGKTGFKFERYPIPDEIPLMLSDLARHRDSLLCELADLEKAEKLLKRAELDEKYRTD